ncbi:MAG: COG4315 family predicted lipoprotein [Microbacterium sp.]
MTAPAVLHRRFTMLSRVSKTAAVAALLMTFAVAGCTSTGGSSGGTTEDTGGAYGQSSESSAPASGSESGSGTLMTADSDLGAIVVDADGKTLYMFDNDTQGSGKSSCTGECLTNWPPLTVASDAPAVKGVTGEVGTIKTADGSTQVTLNGWPLYYFAGDAAAGDVNGQGVGGIWWVLSPAGERMAE